MTPNDSNFNYRKKRLDQLFDECQSQVISNIIGPFGLSMAMFNDKDGGNVTTAHNFGREDDKYVSTDNDKVLHRNSKFEYNPSVRKQYELSQKEWQEKRQDKIINGKIDDYTGREVDVDGKTTLESGEKVRVELDHTKSIGETHRNSKNHLALGEVKIDPETGQATADVGKIRDLVNHDDNLNLTNQPTNGSKSDHDLKEWANKKNSDGKSNIEKRGLDKDRIAKADAKATQHMNRTVDVALLKKQSKELIATGAQQALQMGLRQSMGLLLAELVNGIFNEIKLLIKHGVEIGKSLIQDVIARIKRVLSKVASRFADAMKAFFDGGISGFMSDLLTFLINSLISTSKKIVRMIREGLLGLYKALKMIFFPPENMTDREALQSGLKLLTATVVIAIGILFEESIAVFLATFPILQPIASMITGVLMGIVTGVVSALLAYQIDMFFHGLSEEDIDQLLVNEGLRNEMANSLSESLTKIYENQVHINKKINEISDCDLRTQKNLDKLKINLEKMKGGDK